MKLFLILLISTNCCLCAGTSDLSRGEKMGYRIMRCFAKRMEREKGLHGVGFGGSRKNGKEIIMAIHFSTGEAMTIDSARKLCVETVNEFVEYVNGIDSFRDQMVVYPFTDKNVDITIGGKYPNKEFPFVKMVGEGEGNISYFSDSLAPPNFGCLYEETFEEAERILKEQKSCMQK